MKISDLLRLSTDNLRRRKGRTALTVIGVVVGTCAIVVMISLGIAMNKQNEAILQSWGDLTQISVYNYSQGTGSDLTITDEVLQEFSGYDHVLAVSPQYQMNNFSGSIVAGRNGRYSAYTYNMYGMYAESMEALGFTLQSGSWLSDEAEYGKNKIPVLVGPNSGYNFEDTRRSYNSNSRYRYQGMVDANGNPVEPFVDVEGDKLTLQIQDSEGKIAATYQLVVVGVMNVDYNKGWFTDSGFVMRMSDIKKLEQQYIKLNKIKNATESGYNEVSIKVDDVENVAEVEALISDQGYQTSSMTQVREELQSSVAKSQMMLGGLAAVSLLVAALNIMNTMTMAIYERTREIGVMKVLGCELGHIRAMFLIESGAIGFLGGVVGVVVSYGISAVLNNMTTIAALFGGTVDLSGLMSSMGGLGYGMMEGGSTAISIIPPWLVLLALGFATMVGLFSGIAPAGRAVKISSLEAIRHD